MRRWSLWLGLFWLTGSRLFAGTSREAPDFNAAANLLQLGFYSQAEEAFAKFATNYVTSPRVPEAILYEAQARLQQAKYDGAISLLTEHQAAAGTNADKYLFWLAEATYRKSDFPAATNAFAKFGASYPNSPRRLEAGIGEASARARLSDWLGVITLLDQTNGFFQAASRANATNDLVLRGDLLLSEAHLELHNYPAAEAVIQPAERFAASPDTDWRRQYLICRVQLATGRTNDALAGAARLLTLATNTTQQTTLLPQSAAFQAGLLEQMGRTDEAIAAYQKNLSRGVSEELQRQALWKVTDLSLAENKTSEAVQVLGNFLAQSSNAPSADRALLTLGEVRLRQYLSPATNLVSATTTNAAVETNYLQFAQDALQDFVKRFPQSPLIGNAQLNLGWCFWLQTNLPEARAAFQAAVLALPASTNQAIAYFKLADTQFRQGDFSGAVTNYGAIVDKYAAAPEVAGNLLEPALYQIVQSAVAAHDLPAATNALARILEWYPEGFHTDRALLVAGQAVGQEGNPAAARKMLAQFAEANPGAELLPQVYLAVARTYEQEGLWTNAVQEYNRLQTGFTNSPVRPLVEYYRAQATYKAGDVTNALTQFDGFAAQYPTNELAPRARMWVADYYFQNGIYMQAEANYKMVYRNTNNLPETALTYQAQLMAGHAATERNAWGAARDYFTALYNSANCPTEIKIQAFLAYGDSFMSQQDSTNRAADYETASKIFGRICQDYPTNSVAVVAWGRKADALFQLAKASADPAGTYGQASNAFQQVILSPAAPLSARSEAKVGLAVTLGRLADLDSSTNRVALLKLALSHCLEALDGNTLTRDGEREDPASLFWRKEAGLYAAGFAEALQLWSQAIKINEQLCELVPSARARFEKNIARCKAHLSEIVAP